MSPMAFASMDENVDATIEDVYHVSLVTGTEHVTVSAENERTGEEFDFSYEDVIPYRGRFEDVRAKNRATQDNVATLRTMLDTMPSGYISDEWSVYVATLARNVRTLLDQL